MASKPKIPQAPEQKIPAKSPVRSGGVEEEDIMLGAEQDETKNKGNGRRSLLRPSGFTGFVA